MKYLVWKKGKQIIDNFEYSYSLDTRPEEDVIWRKDILTPFDGDNSMEISTSSRLVLADVFNEYTDPDKQPGFYKTTVPVQIMQYEGESLMSRSQAKRLMNRFDRFLEVVLDFANISFIGQGFADEIFRVFAQAHPGTRLIPVHCTETVEKMIAHVMGTGT
jgi:hypothetical protein